MSQEHYQGHKGVTYFEWQNSIGIKTAKMEARKFSKYVGAEDVILDFGCGGGHILSQLSGKKKIGIEVNEAARKEASRYGFVVYPDLSSVEKNSIDVVISNHCLEHVDRPIDVLRQIHERLRPGGRLALCVPIDDWRIQRKFDRNDINHHLYTWNPQLIGNCLADAGFSVEDIRVEPFRISPVRPDLSSLPEPLYNILCKVYSIVFRSWQILAIAHKNN